MKKQSMMRQSFLVTLLVMLLCSKVLTVGASFPIQAAHAVNISDLFEGNPFHSEFTAHPGKAFKGDGGTEYITMITAFYNDLARKVIVAGSSNSLTTFPSSGFSTHMHSSGPNCYGNHPTCFFRLSFDQPNNLFSFGTSAKKDISPQAINSFGVSHTDGTLGVYSKEDLDYKIQLKRISQYSNPLELNEGCSSLTITAINDFICATSDGKFRVFGDISTTMTIQGKYEIDTGYYGNYTNLEFNHLQMHGHKEGSADIYTISRMNYEFQNQPKQYDKLCKWVGMRSDSSYVLGGQEQIGANASGFTKFYNCHSMDFPVVSKPRLVMPVKSPDYVMV